LSIDFKRFIFVDFGSGKGRAVLLATEFPFRKIVGIEFSHELHQVAQANIRQFNRHDIKCDDIQLLCMDVVDYVLPEECILCYFCNPFDAGFMKEIASRIARSFFDSPRDVFIVYQNPTEAHVIDEVDCFRCVYADRSIRAWKAAAR
jgi:SAM-dependent methyltransferase